MDASYTIYDITGWCVLFTCIGALGGMILMSYMLTGEHKQAPLPPRCRHPFAVCACGAKFQIDRKDILLAPQVCPECQQRDMFGLQEFTLLGDVWVPIAVEAQVTKQCSKVNLQKSDSSRQVQQLNL